MRTRKHNLLSAWMLIAASCCMLNALTADTSGLFTYSDNGSSIAITGYPRCAVGTIEIPSTINGKPVYDICDNAFTNCAGLTNVRIPDSITSIGSSAFCGCIGLTSVTIPGKIARIGSNAFAQCSGLTSIMIPASVISIGNGVFDSCTGLTTITVDALNAGYCSLDGVLFNKNQTTLIVCPGGKAGGLTIHSGVTSIGSGAFYRCTGLTSVTIPSSVTSIGSTAFQNCSGLSHIIIPSSVISIGDNAFKFSTGLTGIIIPAGVTSIGSYTFYCCTGLTGVSLPASVTSIGSHAFDSCTSLTAITVDLPNAKYSSVDGVLYDKKQTMLIQCPGGRAGTVTIPAGVRSIGDNAFDSCIGLTSVTIPATVTDIKSSAFDSCSGLTSITIPAEVTSIGRKAFFSCNGLTSVHFIGNAPVMGLGVFDATATGFTVYYPKIRS